MHGQLAGGGQEVVHDGEHRLLDFSRVLRAANQNQFVFQGQKHKRVRVEFSYGFRIRQQMRCVQNGVFRRVMHQLPGGGPDEHGAGEGRVPGRLSNHPQGHAMGGVRAAE